MLFVSYSGAFGGAERLLLDVASAAEDPVIACPEGPLASAARAAGMRVAVLHERPLRLRDGPAVATRAVWHLVAHAVELRRLARDLDPGLLVAWGMRTTLAAVAARLTCPLAVQANDLAPGRVLRVLLRAAARRAALVTAPSRAVAADLGRGLVIAPGIDAAWWHAGTAPTASAEILLAGALTAVKRPALALEVLAEVRRHVPEARLRVVGAPLPGDGPGVLEALRRRTAELGLEAAVTFAGEVDDMPAEYARATVLLHTGEREAFGMTVLEALAAGRPAVVPDTGGPAEIVTDACGIRYPPGDTAAAARAVVALLRDPARAAALGAGGHERARTVYARGRQRERFRAAWASVALRRPQAAGAGGRVAIVTVTHDSARELPALLRSVDRHLPGAQVVVADAGSRDGSTFVAWGRPGTTVLELDNVGFGRACNRALGVVTAPVTALLNPDVELVDGSLLELTRLAERADGVRGPERLLAPLVLGSDLARQDSVHPAPLSAAALAFALVPQAGLPRPLAERLAPWRAGRARPVGWATGAALLARTETLRRLGPFDERIFLLGEDLELGVRARRAGVPTWFCPGARVVHHGDHSIGPAHGGEDTMRRAQARRAAVALAYGQWGALLDGALQALTFADRLVVKRLAGRDATRERAQLAAALRVSVSGGRSPSPP